MKREEWLKTLKSDESTLTKEQQELDAVIRTEVQKRSVDRVDGPFGDTFRNIGFVEDYPMTDKGIQTKFYGCSYLLKGKLTKEAIDSGATVKRVLMATAELAIKYKFSIVFCFLFSWKKELRDFIYWFADIYEADMRQKTGTTVNEFSPFPREIVNAGLKIAEKIPWEYPLINSGKRGIIRNGNEFRIKVEEVFYCVGSFFQNDFAYYWRGQDVLSNLNKEALLKNPRKEILRLFDLAIERENQIKDKIRLLRKLASITLLFPPIKRFAREYSSGMDVENIKPDEADMYYTGRREGYNFQGRSYEDRKKEIEEIDKEMGNIILRTNGNSETAKTN